MPFYSPLRYPGGKRRLAHAVMELLEANDLRDVDYAEPFAGGAAIGLALLFEEYASTIHINDLSRPVFAFWHSVLHETDELCGRVMRAQLSMNEWDRQRAVYEERDSASLVDLGFAALFLNRTNRSGIIDGGVIGGNDQLGAWRIGARYNAEDLVMRIRRVARYRTRIHVYQADALEFVADRVSGLGQNAFTFLDPPYIENGDGLYLNDYTLDDHRNLAAEVQALQVPWIVTYDTAAIGAGLYERHRRIIYGLRYSAHSRYDGREVMFLSAALDLPDRWIAEESVPLSGTSSRYPLYGRLVTSAS